MLPELLHYRNNINSQAGEDGVLAEILRRLQISNGWFCEFGAWDGKYLSNTYLLLEQGWSGVMIEGDPTKFQDLEVTAANFANRLYPICRFVSPEDGPDSLDSILSSTPIPVEFDVLSIDVDGLDYFIWEGFRKFNPKVVIIEVNSHYPPEEEHLERGANAHSSFASMAILGRRKGYIPVLHTGNVFFVRSDLAANIAADQVALNDWTNQFQFTAKSAKGNFFRQLSRLRQSFTNRLFYSHLRHWRR